VALLAIAVAQRSAFTARRAVIVLGVVALTPFGAIWAAYGFRYLPSSNDAWVFELHDTSLTHNAPVLARVVEWIDSHRLLPNAFTQGVLYTHGSVKQLPGFLAGEISERGWVVLLSRRVSPQDAIGDAPPARRGPAGVCTGAQRVGHLQRAVRAGASDHLLGGAMLSGVNVDLRHILPIYPFVIRIIAAGAREFLRLRRSIGIAALSL
jgi:hypothetical protein